MKRVFKWLGLLLAVGVVVGVYPAYRLSQEIAKAASDDPRVWEGDIAALEEATRERGALRDPVLFIGSSSIRLWSTLAEDMAPLETIRHGFGGAKLADCVHYSERLVNAFSPRAVVVYCGSNDIRPDEAKQAGELLALFDRFVETVHRDLPDLPIYYVGIKPTPRRWPVRTESQAANAAIRELAERTPALHYLETEAAFMNEEGEPDPGFFMFDGLHLNAQGYEAWTRLIRPRLLADLTTPTPHH